MEAGTALPKEYKIKLALIPPFGWEHYTRQSTIHLALALPNLLSASRYMDAFYEAKCRGEYIIMDNGAAEGVRLLAKEIRKAGELIRADEIVLPDCIGDKLQTRKAVHEYIVRHYRANMKYMAVLQGRDLREVKTLAEQFANIEVRTVVEQKKSAITVLGIPRHFLESLHEGVSVRIDLANWIREEFGDRFEIHMLGASPLWITEARHVAKYASHVRSMDTSMPFNYALTGHNLETCAKSRRAVRRPAAYFDRVHDIQGFEYLANANVRFMQSMTQEVANV